MLWTLLFLSGLPLIWTVSAYFYRINLIDTCSKYKFHKVNADILKFILRSYCYEGAFKYHLQKSTYFHLFTNNIYTNVLHVLVA